MMAAATLLFCNSGQMCRVLFFMVVVVESSLGSLLGLTQVYAFLFRVVRLFDFTTIALYMSRSLLSFETTVVALSDRPSLLRNQGEFAVSMSATTHTVTFEA